MPWRVEVQVELVLPRRGRPVGGRRRAGSAAAVSERITPQFSVVGGEHAVGERLRRSSRRSRAGCAARARRRRAAGGGRCSACSSDAAISLNAPASCASSSVPRDGHPRACERRAAIRCAAAASARTGRTIRVETSQLTASAVAIDAATATPSEISVAVWKAMSRWCPTSGGTYAERVADVAAEDRRAEQQRDEQQRPRAGEHDQQLPGEQLRAQAAPTAALSLRRLPSGSRRRGSCACTAGRAGRRRASARRLPTWTSTTWSSPNQSAAPHPLEQPLAAERHPRLADSTSSRSNSSFVSSTGSPADGAPRAPPGRSRGRRTGAPRRPARRRVARPAEHRPDAGHQLARRERLGHVVVGAGREADDPVDLLDARGQHHDVGVAERADLPARLDPVDSRAASGRARSRPGRAPARARRPARRRRPMRPRTPRARGTWRRS